MAFLVYDKLKKAEVLVCVLYFVVISSFGVHFILCGDITGAHLNIKMSSYQY